MRRSFVMLLSMAVVVGTLLIGVATAQGSSASEFSDHPLVGTWTLVTDPDPESLPSMVVFSSDGTFLEVGGAGFVQAGAWEPTGDSTANLFIISYDPDEGSGIIRASIEVAADAQTFTALYTIEFFDPATGEKSGEYGPSEANGTRLVVEPMGTPVGTLENLFAQFSDDEDATPEP